MLFLFILEYFFACLLNIRPIFKIFNHRYMAEILQNWGKTPSNQPLRYFMCS